MCEKCFPEEIKSFPTQDDFEAFDLKLTMKIANEKSMCLGDFVNTAYKDEGYQIYLCRYCGQKWKLLAPDYSNKGDFLRM